MPSAFAAVILFVLPLLAFVCGIGVGLAIAKGQVQRAAFLTVAGFVFALGDLALMMWVASQDMPMAQ